MSSAIEQALFDAMDDMLYGTGQQKPLGILDARRGNGVIVAGGDFLEFLYRDGHWHELPPYHWLPKLPPLEPKGFVNPAIMPNAEYLK